ncbi:MAG TPA: hypothetical protein VMT49_08780 [Steroidobacteraceae bacterium]|nr:hypothetical protein [Steroidobacteraceae bacterium]
MAALALLWAGSAGVRADTMEPYEQVRMQYEMAHYGICASYGCSNGGGPRIGYDPCFLALNAMRPCTTSQLRGTAQGGVDPHLVGAWELPFKDSFWMLEVRRDGTYRFRNSALAKGLTVSGKFSAADGHWSLQTAGGYADGGNYLFQAPDVWIATGKLGAAAWRRAASFDGPVQPCPVAHQAASRGGAIDPDIVGTWVLPLKGGHWVWEIGADGTYRFHSEAGDGAPPHSGKFAAALWHWSLTATNGYTDTGLYYYQAPDMLLATGRLGAAAWRRPATGVRDCPARERDSADVR